MATVKLLLGIVCFAFTYSIALPGGSLLKQTPFFTELKMRERIVDIARRELGVKELTGYNDGLRVEAYLSCTGLKKGFPWCASYVSWVYQQAGYDEPRSAWSPDLFPKARLTKSPMVGDIIGIYFPGLKRIAHVGIVERIDGDWSVSLEGNTNINGSRNGDGVYRRRRHLKTIYQFANWFNAKKQKS